MEYDLRKFRFCIMLILTGLSQLSCQTHLENVKHNNITSAYEQFLQQSDIHVPVYPLSRGPDHHWFAYYDKYQTDPSDQYVLSMEVDFEHRSPKPNDEIKIDMFDLQKGGQWIELGSSRAWNWQQGVPADPQSSRRGRQVVGRPLP